MEGILASIMIPILSAILKNYQEISEKSFEKEQELDTKCRPKGGKNVLWTTEMFKNYTVGFPTSYIGANH